MDNISYHGTNESNSKIIIGPPPNLDITIGKGELGRGFYTGSSIALAAIWAQNRYKEKGVVIEFDIPKSQFVQLKGFLIKTKVEIVDNWRTLKIDGEATTYEFGYDYIIAPFATIEHTGNQYKFESKKAENELNAATKKVYRCEY
jgi:hypothetical protein